MVIILLGFDHPLHIPGVNFLLISLSSELPRSVIYLFNDVILYLEPEIQNIGH